MTNYEQDRLFILHIINEIAKYANENGMEVDDTINKVSEWLFNLTLIATFNNLKGDREIEEVD